MRLGWASLFFVNIEHQDEQDDDEDDDEDDGEDEDEDEDEDDDENEDENDDEDDVEERVRKLIKKRSMMCGTFICKFTPSLWLSSDIRLSFLKGSR